ncbi:MAG TPA: FAD-dependent monooxygenase [Streptosporangiaceae bacterium]|nr:FAD-dependent monooxygenase [Streptosporangiaceae bacterium]
MSSRTTQTADVVIVGGGPTGLMLAAELRLGGANPVVLERLPDISQIPKGNGLVGQIVPTLDYRGLTERFRAETTFIGAVPQFPFGPLRLDFSRLGAGAGPLHILAIPQRRLEEILRDWLRELGGDVRRGHEVLGLSLPGADAPDGTPVTLDVRGPDGDYRLGARYVVGCDGAHSLVRKQARIAFPGVTSSETSRIGRVLLPTVRLVPRGWATGPADMADVPGVGRVPLMMTTQTPRGAYSLAPLTSLDKNAEPGMFIVYTREDDSPGDRDAPMTLDELRGSARRVLGADLPMSDPQLLTRIVANSRQAERYRSGPALLAGDAAHIFGAGGSLNTGLLDAINLGWKLAAQVAGWAPDGLLDSYHAERHLAGQRALLQTRAQKALSARGEYADALRELFGELMQEPEAVRHVGSIVEGSDVRYPVPAGGGRPHPLAGRLAPDLRLDGVVGADGVVAGVTRVAELVRPARGVLLDLTGSGAAADGALARVASPWRERVNLVAGRPVAEPPPAAAMLIRPDGYVAWAVGPEARALVGGLPEALRAWFGTPS